MIAIGIILLLIGFLTGIPVIWTIGIIVLVIGLVALLLGVTGRRTPALLVRRPPSGAGPRRCRCRPGAGPGTPDRGAEDRLPRTTRW